jgi:ribonuclease R
MREAIGTFSRTKKGFGFVNIEELGEDAFIAAKFTQGAFNGDLVKIIYTDSSKDGKRKEGKVVEILERNTTEVIGRFRDCGDFGFVEPEDIKICSDIYISKKRNRHLYPEDGQVVAVNIYSYSTNSKSHEGIISEIIGFPEEKGVEIATIVKRFNLNTVFNEDVQKEVSKIEQTVDKNEIPNRVDLRDKLIITIDGEDAKDLDDAISLEMLPNGNFYLGVHIADVTHYVKEKSHLDKEAYARATSVYLVDEVIPMLPKELSNGICSLNPSVDRLTLSCFMEINKNGKVVNSSVVESLINTTERMNYSDVTKILKGQDKELEKRYAHILDLLFLAEKLEKILNKKRMDRGGIDFDFKESKIELDENRKPISIKAYERDISNRIIEEFMLVCNETIAEKFNKLEVPFVYRIHEKPRIEKFESLNEF